MQLTEKMVGSRFGPYEILAPLGAGGMGEVYRAQDPRLKREVALKILPAEVVGVPEKEKRFRQEAQAASALNHPNILVVYDVGSENGNPYIVTELVDGEPLRKQIQKGPVPFKQLMDLILQIASGLAAAHEAGIIHRDLKPENIMVTRDGRVKILDFGLAKLLTQQPGVTQDDTISHEFVPSRIIRGTVPYMSPEQASGKEIDFRSDQFSFGVIVYEMATGKRAFARATTGETLSAIISEEPVPISTLNSKIPAPIRWIVERCLAKEPRQRYDSTADLYRELRNLHDHLSEAISTEVVRSAGIATTRKKITMGFLFLALLGMGGLLTAFLLRPDMPNLAFYRFSPLATDAGYEGEASWSPDGKTIAYTARVNDIRQIFIRSLSAPTPAVITNSPENCSDPFWSPDGSHIFYFALGTDNKNNLWTVSAAGGSTELVMANVEAATISPDAKTLAFLRSEEVVPKVSLWISSPVGAEPKKYVPFADKFYRLGTLHFSPDGSQIGIWIRPWTTEANSSITEFWTVPYPSGKPAKSQKAVSKMATVGEFSWLPDSRHFVFDGQDHLWMADLKKDTVQPVTVSSNKEVNPSVSPDGKTIAYTLEQDDFDLIEIPLDGSPSRSLLSTSQNEMMPAWSPIGNQFAYVTDRTGVAEIWIKSLQERWDRPLVTSKDFGNDPTYLFAYPSFSPDGQRIAYQRIGGKGEIATWISTVAGGPPVRLTRDPLSSRATWSPDGNWMAYISGTEGNFVLAKVKVGGGSPPVILKNDAFLFPPQWSPKGDLICYLSTQGLALVTQDGKANRLFEARLLYNLGWSKDGSTLYGIMEVPGPWRIAVLSYDVLTGKEKIIVDLGSSADLKNIEGFSLSPDGKTFATSIARAKGDIWLLDGFNKKQSFFDLIWRK